MDYEKMYKEALKRVRRLHDRMLVLSSTDALVASAELEFIFPELTESEDERIRQELIDFIQWAEDRGTTRHDYHQAKRPAVWIAWLEKQKEASKAIEAVDRIDKYIDEHLANAHDMKDSNPDKKYYRGWDDALGEMARILQDVYSGEKQKENIEKEYVFRPLAGTDITIAAEQAIRRANEGDHLVLAFNGVYLPVRKYNSAKELVDEYDACFEKQKENSEIPINASVCSEKPNDHSEWNDFEIRLMDCMCAAQQYRTGTISWDVVKGWAEELNELKKPAEWNANNKAFIKDCARILDENGYTASAERLLSMFEQKPEWSKEDEKDMAHIIRILDDCYAYGKHDLSKTDHENLVNKLKSLRPSWKPSEEQMKALNKAIPVCMGVVGRDAVAPLESLCEQLEKLM